MRLFYFALLSIGCASCSVPEKSVGNIAKNVTENVTENVSENIVDIIPDNTDTISDKVDPIKQPILFETKVIAHGGAWKTKNFPFNSIASLRQAIQLKYGGSEFDILMTVDDSLVITHGPLYNNLQVEKTKYDKLIAFKLPNGEKLPTLREYLIAGLEMNSSTLFMSEIKKSQISAVRDAQITTKVVELVHKLKAQDKMVYNSFDYAILKKIRALDSKAVTIFIDGSKSPEQLKADGVSGMNYNFSVYRSHPEWIESARKNNLILHVWTVNASSDIDWAITTKFDMIVTDEPELVFERLKK
jgi:glycerophosphoryl diester phosphodiesterase